jgi:predicted phosphodiesterase
MSIYHPASATEFIDFISKIVNPLKFKPVVVRIDKGPVLWVGDIHGFYDNITHAIELAKENSVSTVIFLGDYVDRGPLQTQSLINIAYSFAISEGYEGSFNFIDPLFQESFPFRIIALKGNHEDITLNKKYDFLSKIVEIYGNSNLKSIIQSLEIVYEHFPIIVETSWGTLGVHGGIPEFNNTIELEMIKTLRKLKIPIKHNPPALLKLELKLAIEQILWNDPNEKLSNEHVIFSDSMRGSPYKVFNQKAFNAFKKNLGFNRLVRGHQSSRGAFDSLWNDTLIHIFSAFPYFGKCNTPAFFLEFEDGSGKIIDHQNQTLYSIKK